MDTPTMDTPTCRVCRTEATPDQPLFHPCKCRGSMKYIHQECLEFWLQHSNKRHCDICHTPFRFNIIYDESTPSRLPARYLLAQAFSYLVKFQYLALKSFLALLAIAQTFYSFSILNTLIDILLGVDTSPPPLLPTSLPQFLANFTSGALSATIYALLTLAMVLIQNSFIMDQGFQTIIDTHIGRPVVARSERIGDMINRLQQLQQQQQQQRQEQHPPHPPLDAALAQSYATSGVTDSNGDLSVHQLASIRDFALQHASTVNSPYTDHIDDAIHTVLAFSPEQHHSDTTRLASFRQAERTIREAVVERELHEDHPQPPPPPPPPQEQQPNLEELANILADVRNIPDEDDQQPEQQPPPPPQEINFFSNKNSISFIVQITFIANVASMALLILHKFFPSVIASLTFPLIAKLLSLLNRPNYYQFAVPLHSYISRLVSPLTTHLTFLTPLTSAITNIAHNTPSDAPLERLLAQLSGIAIIISAMHLIMWKLEKSCSQQNPLAGTYRSVYISLLQFVSVFKVLTLLIIEWVLFPLFAGSQVEFALVPIFNSQLDTYQLHPQLFNHLLPKLLIKWLIGTFFMYYFASFVSMIRTKILRNGVMFFIRPSDDPNVQIVHDAIMRPFSLRISRIALSAAVYSIYILFQFTIPAWSLRLLSPIPILPFHNTTLSRYAYTSLFLISKFMEPFFIKYWSHVFSIACKLTKLSHFMLNKDEPSERSPNGYLMRAPSDDHVSRRFVRTLFYPVTENDTLINPLPPIPDDEAYFNPYGDVDPLEFDSYIVVYRPPYFKLRLIVLFYLLELASFIYTLALYIANIFLGKLILNITHLSHLLGLPTQLYRVDLPSLLITFTILSQSPHIINNNNNASIISHIRSQLTTLSQNRLFLFLIHRAESILQLTAYLYAANYALGNYIITNNSSLIILSALTTLPPIIATLRHITNDKHKFVSLSALIIITRILISTTSHQQSPPAEVVAQIQSATSVEQLIALAHNNALQPDTYITTRIVSLFLPEQFTRLFYRLEFAHYESTESALYFLAWSALALWTGTRYLVHGWKTFSELTREKYFASNKILANVDE